MDGLGGEVYSELSAVTIFLDATRELWLHIFGGGGLLPVQESVEDNAGSFLSDGSVYGLVVQILPSCSNVRHLN